VSAQLAVRRANCLASERLGYKAPAELFKAALGELLDMAALVVEARAGA
jgi:hypothetical protein